MLVARGSRTLRRATMRWALGFGQRLWFKIIEAEGLRAYDTQFMPAAPGPAKPQVCLYLALSGRWRWGAADAPAVATPALIPLTLAQLEGANGVRHDTFSVAVAEGAEPVRIIELHVPESEVVGWPLSQPNSLRGALLSAALRAAQLSTIDDAGLTGALAEALRLVAGLGLLREGFVADAVRGPSRPIVRIWRAVQPTIEGLSLSAKVDDLASLAGLSESQIERGVQRLFSAFGFVVGGVRSLTHHVRMKTAAYFLSADDVTIAEVAELAGYGSVDAMGRAFRDAGLPAPREIQRVLHPETG